MIPAMARLASLILLAVTVGACTVTGGGTQIATTLHDDSIVFDRAEVPAGTVTFVIENQGTMAHEVEVFAGAGPGLRLPVVAGVADTTGLTLIDEVEDIVVGTTTSLTVDLEPGTYLVICNLPGHYALGMTIELVVTG